MPSVIQRARPSVGVHRFAFRLARRAEGEALDDTPGEAAGLFMATGGGGGGGKVIPHVGEVFVGLAEAGLFHSMSPAEQQLRPALQEAHWRKKRRLYSAINTLSIWTYCD